MHGSKINNNACKIYNNASHVNNLCLYGFCPGNYIILHNKLYVCAGHLHYTILPDAFSHDATAALQIYM